MLAMTGTGIWVLVDVKSALKEHNRLLNIQSQMGVTHLQLVEEVLEVKRGDIKPPQVEPVAPVFDTPNGEPYTITPLDTEEPAK